MQNKIAPDIDVEALRGRYNAERDRRLRADGAAQYLDVTRFPHLTDDPYVEPGFTRDAKQEEVDVVIIGGGFAGLSMGANLRKAGFESLRIIERGGDFGGAWYWNRYPGVQCDIDSYCYLPLLEETGYMPKEKYCYGSEIFAHAQRIGRHFDLYPSALFQTEVSEVRWNDFAARWIIKTNRSDRISARFVVLTSGTLDKPKLPGIPGLASFEGHIFHTSRWDYLYTGGDTSGGLTRLADKSVAVIGTGATGIQVVPYLARDAGQLYVVQRTPSSVDRRGNAPTDSEWAKTLKDGWQQQRRHNFTALTSGLPQAEDLVNDGWTNGVSETGGMLQSESGTSDGDPALAAELADFRKMNELRARVDTIVQDKATAEALKPWYRRFCKRPTFNDQYLAAFNQPNVKLLDTKGLGPERFTKTGIVVDGREYPIDCVVFATGFEVGTAQARRMGFDVYGRTGKTLSETWANGLKSLHGFYTHGFPNFFHMGVNQNGFTYILTYMLDEQAKHIASILTEARARKAEIVEVNADAERAWGDVIEAKSEAVLAFQSECTPGFYNGEGQIGRVKTVLEQTYGGGPLEFFDMMKSWLEAGNFEGVEFRQAKG